MSHPHGIHRFLFLALLLGTSMGQGPNEVLSFNYQVFAPNDLVPNGPIYPVVSAQYNATDSSILMCERAPTQLGGIWYKDEVQVRGFNITFGFVKPQDGGEGFALVIQTVANGTILGPLSSGLGYGDNTARGTAGIIGSLALEFDSHQDVELGDPAQDHMGVHFNPTSPSGPNSAFETAALGGSTTSIPRLMGTHTVNVVYEPNGAGSGSMAVTWDTNGGPTLTREFLLENVATLSTYGKAWIGFTSTTGTEPIAAALYSWSYEFLGKLNPAKTTILNAGALSGQAGNTVSIYIQGYDQYGNEMITGNTPTSWNLTLNTEIVKFEFTDFLNGSYRVDFIPTIASQNIEMSITLNGIAIAKSPALLKISPGIAVPNMTVAHVTAGQTGLTGGIAGELNQFSVQLFDAYNNSVTDITGQNIALTGTLTGPSTVNVVFNSPTDGVFPANYNITQVGVYKLDIYMNNIPIRNSGFPILITAAGVDGTKTIAYGIPNLLIAGVPVEFYLQMRDTFGNNITDTPANPPKISVTMGGGYSATVTPVNGGLYKISGTATDASVPNLQLSVTVNSLTIPGSPFSIQINPSTDVFASHCLASGTNLNHNTAGNPSTVLVQTRDYWNNTLKTEDKGLVWELDITNEDDQVIPSNFNVTYVSQGSYLIAYNVTKAGNASLHISINGTEINDSPFTLETVANVAFGPNCQTDGQQALLYTDQAETFHIVTFDEFKNPIPHGGAKFDSSVTDTASGATLSAPVIDDMNNGKYFVNYTIEHSGMYSLKISVNGRDIAGSPFSIKVKWAGLPTPIVVVIGVSCAVFVLLIGLGVWFYQTKWKKRRQYTALRDTEPAADEPVPDTQL